MVAPKGRIRPWLLAVLAGTVVGTAGVIVVGELSAVRATGDEPVPPSPAEARAARESALLHVAPGPLPQGLPLLGSEGDDIHGYPLRYVDRVGLRSLLFFRRFGELTAHLEAFQTAFETDARKELWPLDAVNAFASSEPELRPLLDAWVAATPDSFAPYVARGAHLQALALARRGGRTADRTPEEDLAAMTETSAAALVDLARAVALRPRLLVALTARMVLAMYRGDAAGFARALEAALAVCGDCFEVHRIRLTALTPRWGGSYDAMGRVVASLPAHNSRLGLLVGYAPWDRADRLLRAQDLDGALAANGLALGSGSYFRYHEQRGVILAELERYEESLADLDQADRLRPLCVEVLVRRARVRGNAGDRLGAGRDLLMALRIDPADNEAKRVWPWVLSHVLRRARDLEEQGEHGAALDAAELGLALGSGTRDAVRTHEAIVVGDATTPERIAELEEKVRVAPGDFRLVQQLDYALARGRQWGRVLPLWDAYLALHPEDARAWVERSGTYANLGRGAESHADAERGCELGNHQGCARAARQ